MKDCRSIEGFGTMKLTLIDFINTYPGHYVRYWQLAAADAGFNISDSQDLTFSLLSEKLFISVLVMMVPHVDQFLCGMHHAQ